MNVKDTQDFLVSQVEEEELPDLEFIEDTEVSPHIQVQVRIGTNRCCYVNKKLTQCPEQIQLKSLLLRFHVQDKEVNPFSALLNGQNSSCSELAWTSNSGSPSTNPKCPSSSFLPPPDVIQIKTSFCEADLKVRRH